MSKQKHQVRIEASQNVRYVQTLKLTDEELEDFKDQLERHSYGEVAESWLNLHDIFDADSIDEDDVEITIK